MVEALTPYPTEPPRWAKVIDHTRCAGRQFSPDGTRRPSWLLRPLKPGREAFRLPKGG
jgi:hypothetical protein